MLNITKAMCWFLIDEPEVRNVRGQIAEGWLPDSPSSASLAFLLASKQGAKLSDEALSVWQTMIRYELHDATRHEAAMIDHARQQGRTWQQVADLMELGSRQAAQQRHSALTAQIDKYHRDSLAVAREEAETIDDEELDEELEAAELWPDRPILRRP